MARSIWAAMFGASFIRMNSEHFAAFLPKEERAELELVQIHVADLLMDALARRPEPDR